MNVAKKIAQTAPEQPRIGDWIETYSGLPYWPLDPRRAEVRIGDIAHSLAMQCRFGGHCIRFYSVAEHSILLADKMPTPEEALEALLHDASEAYLNDITRPVKKSLPQYRSIEAANQRVIYEAYNLNPNGPSQTVKIGDARILIDESRQNMRTGGREWYFNGQTEPLGVQLQYWTPYEAEARFHDAFSVCQRQLFG